MADEQRTPPPRLRRVDQYYGLRVALDDEGSREAVIFMPAPFSQEEARRVQEVCGVLESAAEVS